MPEERRQIAKEVAMRLNGWQRAGLVLSLIWIVGAAIYQRSADIDRAEDFAKYAYKVCSDSKSLAHDNNLASCEKERSDNLEIWLKGSWGNVAFLSFVPVPFGWLAAFILLNVSRAAVIGFRSVVPWATLSSPKKVFVVFCILASCIAILFGITAVLNLYAEKQVPVMLGGRASVYKFENSFVQVRGTWTREGSTEGSMLGYPLQTSEIMCYRTSGRCTEARASVAGSLLYSELVEYPIESWSNTTVVFRNDALCTTEVFTIDLKTESVNGAGHTIINPNNEYCNKFETGKEERWNYHLVDGFKVYWDLKQKARPFPLRIIQALFGN